MAVSDDSAFYTRPIPGRHDLTEEEATAIAKATIAKIRKQQRTEVTALKEAILDIDAHATPLGFDADGFVGDGYLVTVGAMHRALGLVGHTAAPCDCDCRCCRRVEV